MSCHLVRHFQVRHFQSTQTDRQTDRGTVHGQMDGQARPVMWPILERPHKSFRFVVTDNLKLILSDLYKFCRRIIMPNNNYRQYVWKNHNFKSRPCK